MLPAIEPPETGVPGRRNARTFLGRRQEIGIVLAGNPNQREQGITAKGHKVECGFLKNFLKKIFLGSLPGVGKDGGQIDRSGGLVDGGRLDRRDAMLAQGLTDDIVFRLKAAHSGRSVFRLPAPLPIVWSRLAIFPD